MRIKSIFFFLIDVTQNAFLSYVRPRKKLNSSAFPKRTNFISIITIYIWCFSLDPCLNRLLTNEVPVQSKFFSVVNFFRLLIRTDTWNSKNSTPKFWIVRKLILDRAFLNNRCETGPKYISKNLSELLMKLNYVFYYFKSFIKIVYLRLSKVAHFKT